MAEAIPSNTAVERVVLGSILHDTWLMDSARSTLDVADFLLEDHRRVWSTACALYDRGVPVGPVAVFAEAKGKFTLEYLGGLTNGIPELTNLTAEFGILKEKAALRKIANIAAQIQTRCLLGEDDSDTLQAALSKLLTDLRDQGPAEKRPVSTRELIDTVGIDELLSPRRKRGIHLPWGRLNQTLCGLHPGQMIVLAAYTGRGKTSLALQVATHVTRQSASAIYWSLEMEPKALFRRVVNQLTGLDHEKARHGLINAEERVLVRDAAMWLYDHPLYFDFHSRTIPSFCASLRQARAKHDIQLAVVDYLQLVRFAGRAESRTREVGENSRALKLAALDFGIPFLVLSQFRRPNSDKEASIHDLKESGDIENDADVILLMNSGEMNAAAIPVQIHIGKQREGPMGMDIPLMFRPASQSFHAMED